MSLQDTERAILNDWWRILVVVRFSLSIFGFSDFSYSPFMLDLFMMVLLMVFDGFLAAGIDFSFFNRGN
jgi:hypothetical protein